MTEPDQSARPVHLRWRYLGLVAVGGTVGTALRELLSLSIPVTGSFPTVIFCINIVGAFALGVLLESLVRRGPDEGARRNIRLTIGTGVLGGFTTYSALATSTALLLVGGEPWVGIAYALGSVLVGAGASWVGIAVSATLHRRSEHSSDGRPTPDAGGTAA